MKAEFDYIPKTNICTVKLSISSVFERMRSHFSTPN